MDGPGQGADRLKGLDNSAASVALQRRESIVDLVAQRGFLSVESLAERFGVTPQTIRRDVNALYDEGRVNRYHGGAGPPMGGSNLGYSARQVLQHAAKRRIARMVARHIPHGASLILNIGTTTEEVARALVGHHGLRVVTNNLNVATVLMQGDDCEIILAGGLVRNGDGGVVGEATLDLIRQFRVDFAVVGISGIDGDGTLLDYDYREVRVSQAILASARRVFLAADHSKFGRPAMVRMGSLADVHALFTDEAPPESILRVMTEVGVELHVAEQDPKDDPKAEPNGAD